MSDYYCDCSCDDYDTPELYRQTIRQARKAHRCCECRETIEPGERYQLAEGKWDGYFDRYKTCLPCVRMRRDFQALGWCFGDLGYAIRECIGVDPYKVPDEEGGKS